MVKDNVTDLVWEMKTNKDGKKDYSNPHDADNTYTWYDSNPATNGGKAGTPGNGTDTEDFIQALNDAYYGGYSDWRMPTIKELAYIVNYSIAYPSGPTITTGYFPNTGDILGIYWSSTTLAGARYTDIALVVYFCCGFDSNNGTTASNYVRAVRGGQTKSDYVGDGTVTDISTGLMWKQAGPTTYKSWEQSLAYCEGLNLGGHTDWRLPTIKELRSLVDYDRHDPAINTTYFPNALSSLHWSSTTDVEDTLDKWCVDFKGGRGSTLLHGDYVRAVRGGQPGSLGHLGISPTSRSVSKDTGTITFSVSNTGTGTMHWTDVVTTGGSWLSITSGVSGTDAGTINCSFTTNTSLSSRTATNRVTAPGATGSPVDVAVTQAPKPQTDCTATLDENFSLHIPYITYGTLLLWADSVYEYNPMYPTLIPFKMVANAVTPTYLCEASTLSTDLKIHIPDVLFPDRSNRLWMDMEYSPAFSTDGNIYFVVTKYGVVSN